MSNSMIELIGSVILVVVIIVIAASWSKVSDYLECSSYESMTERSTKYSILSGCYVDTDKGWIPREEMSKRAITDTATPQ